MSKKKDWSIAKAESIVHLVEIGRDRKSVVDYVALELRSAAARGRIEATDATPKKDTA